MTSALTLSASEHADVRPVSYDVRHTELRLRGLEIDRLVAILGVRISPRPTPKRLRLVSADGRLGPGNIQIRCLFRRWYSGIVAGETSFALTMLVYKSM